jgi:PAS domain S-box-containing protein
LRPTPKSFEDLTDPIIVEGVAGNILDMNPEAERTYGWSREELINQPVTTLVPPESHSQADEFIGALQTRRHRAQRRSCPP